MRAVRARAVADAHGVRPGTRRMRHLLRAVGSSGLVDVPQLGRGGQISLAHHRIRKSCAGHEHRRHETFQGFRDLETHREHLVVVDVLHGLHRSGHARGARLAVDENHLAVHRAARRRGHHLRLGHARRALGVAHFVLELVNLAAQRVAGVTKQHLEVDAVATLLLVGKGAVQRASLRQKPLLVDPRQKRHRLPREALTVHIELEFLGVKVDDGRIRVLHQRVECRRQRVAGGGGKNAHELLEGAEGLPLDKVLID